MNTHCARFCVLALACTLLTACHDRREPVKPTVINVLASAGQGLPAQAGTSSN